MATRAGRRVFLSYAYRDALTAERVAHALAQAGIVVSNSEPIQAHDTAELKDRLRDSLRGSDVVIVLVSEAAVASPWVAWELEQAASGRLRRRGIEVVAATLDGTLLPEGLRGRGAVNLQDDLERGLEDLVAQIDAATRVAFDTLSPADFEALVADLLQAQGLTVELGLVAEGADLRATRQVNDPFGGLETETWLVECKHYRRERASVDAIRQAVGLLATAPAGVRGLLVTTAQLTSVASDYLAGLERSARVRLRVLDGSDLTTLLRAHPEVAARHFPERADPHDLA
jgi:hypothetical protein